MLGLGLILTNGGTVVRDVTSGLKVTGPGYRCILMRMRLGLEVRLGG